MPISDKVWRGQRYAKKTSVQDDKIKIPLAIVEFSEIEWATCWAFEGFEGLKDLRFKTFSLQGKASQLFYPVTCSFVQNY